MPNINLNKLTHFKRSLDRRHLEQQVRRRSDRQDLGRSSLPLRRARRSRRGLLLADGHLKHDSDFKCNYSHNNNFFVDIILQMYGIES
jgi:hypothetical protein